METLLAPVRLASLCLLAGLLVVAIACSGGGQASSPSPTPYVEEPHGGSGCLCDSPPDPRFLKIDPAELRSSGAILWGSLDLQAGTPVTPEEREQAWFGGDPAERLEGEAATFDTRIPVATSPLLTTAAVGSLYESAGSLAGATVVYGAASSRVLIGWTRGGQGPLTIRVGDDLIGVRQELGAYRVRVNGTPGVLEEWSSTTARGGNRFHSVVIVWVDDGVVWTLMSSGLRAEEALEVADSIRPMQAP